MTRTAPNLPVCVHCGTPRPADEELCPNCGMPWIDSSIHDAITASGGTAAATTHEGSAAPAPSPSTPPLPAPPPLEESGEFDFGDWTLPPDPKRSKAWWLILPMAVVAVVALWITVFVDSDERADSLPVVVAAVPTTPLAPTTTVSSSVTEPQETTSTTTTTIFFPAADSWHAVGEAIPTSDLALKASGIGPIDIGSPISEAAGALVSSLGVAQGAGIDSDTCPGANWYWLEWGNLVGIFDGYTPSAEFVGYAYQSDQTSEPDPMLETLSGIRLGDTVETLHRTYASYTISFEVIEGKDHFRLSDGGELLLWGPVSSTEPQGTVEGIYSPEACPSEN
jgi:hypothetical protein